MRKHKEIVGQLLLTRYDYCWDGGSIYLIGKDVKGNEIEIVLRQRMLLDNFNESAIPGRLYINKSLVAQRSEYEKIIVDKLRTAKIEAEIIHPPKWMSMKDGLLKRTIKLFANTPSSYENKTIASWVQTVVSFVLSEEYLLLSKRLEQTDNKT